MIWDASLDPSEENIESFISVLDWFKEHTGLTSEL